MLKFTGHNILLDNGERTIPEIDLLLHDSRMWKSIEGTVQLFFGNDKNSYRDLKAVDLGCLDGGYTVEFARMGFDATGIDAREDNIQNCNYVKDHLSLPNLHFIQDDARNVVNYGKFDITLCYGLLYHLDDPANFLKLLYSCTNKMLLIHTHYAPEHNFRYSLGPLNEYFIAPIQKRVPAFNRQKNWRLSKIETNEGYKGRWFKEWNKNAKRDKINKLLHAAYNNYRAFWPCKKDLVQAIRDAGFRHVFEQTDFIGDMAPENYISFQNRSMFVAIK